jgi:CYTH domain-containing protein
MSVNIEYERKFLIKKLPDNLIIKEIYELEQSYLSDKNDKITVRIRKEDEKYIFCIKKHVNNNLIEFEKDLSKDEYDVLISICNNYISKTRLTVYSEKNNMDYYIDIFHGKLNGLIIAEVETITNDTSKVNSFIKEVFFNKEISKNKRYSNLKLAYLGLPFRFDYKN